MSPHGGEKVDSQPCEKQSQTDEKWQEPANWAGIRCPLWGTVRIKTKSDSTKQGIERPQKNLFYWEELHILTSLFVFILFLAFWDRVSLYRPDCLQIHRCPPASAFQVLGLKAYATTAQLVKHFPILFPISSTGPDADSISRSFPIITTVLYTTTLFIQLFPQTAAHPELLVFLTHGAVTTT